MTKCKSPAISQRPCIKDPIPFHSVPCKHYVNKEDSQILAVTNVEITEIKTLATEKKH